MHSTLNTPREGHADLQDKYDAFSHTTSQKLATQAAELTVPEVKSSPPPPRRTKQLRLSAPKLSLCNLHPVLPPSRRATSRDTKPKRQAASVLRAGLTR